ncbi:MAG: aspartate aminotransferase family protein [Acidiferrobacteraceae bacterium]|jgi:acetylornithine/N-succinyldiaminopimelate aminotransferase|nr:aspartate aminotransferase family protein [Acidiferrobacteraceae bacterium]MDP6551040.1 acetylornithine/succinyldiaminopimelate transaminase [Arenicellales bacterium]MDP6791849.1 acetylornithine/succinyldiaminopimelate transaminase [Arenicellales bacterium]MDP6918301.1 acetylornithine/succinyldiaminopimelate transaminase [Arenicellales bacterium]|tara:strand:- start:23216 stop:24433 length:1218 start_codon:yes stop_codon:yes gene_type:complete
MSTAQREWYDSYLMPNYAPAPMIPVRGSGSRMWDQEGREYIDFAGGIAVNALGHAHPDLVAALTDQAGRLWHTANILATEPALNLARQLVELTFAEKVFFCNSGAEANEAALKLARRYAFDHHGKQKDRILAFDNAFHGRTLFTVTAGGQANYREGFGPLPGAIEHLPFNDTKALNEAFADDVCAVIVEPVQGEGGVIAADKTFLQAIRRLCDEHHALMILDEVQTGVGRVGTLYAYQAFDVVPDILTTGKGLGGGFPVAAALSKADVAESLKVGTHGSTWGGNPMGCAVASTVLDIVSSEAVLKGVSERRQRFEKALRTLGDKYGLFGEIRGMGLLIGCVLNEPWQGKARDLMHAAQEEGVFVLIAGASVLRMAPSLIIPEEDIAEGLERLERAIACFCESEKA